MLCESKDRSEVISCDVKLAELMSFLKSESHTDSDSSSGLANVAEAKAMRDM